MSQQCVKAAFKFSNITCISAMSAGAAAYPLQYTLALSLKSVDRSFHDFLAQSVVLLDH